MKIVVAIMASALAFSAADAQAGSTPAGKSDAAELQKVDAHIKQLHSELKITSSEEAQWDNVAKTMRENAENIDRVIDKREATIGSATAVEDLNSYAEVVEAHAQAVKRLADSFSALYSEMSDGQKRTADGIFSHRHHGQATARN